MVLFENLRLYVQGLLMIIQMEANTSVNQQANNGLTLFVPSKKIQINSIDQEEAAGLKQEEGKYEQVTAIRIEGNSYSLQFCKAFGDLLKKTKNIKDLNINDAFVSRLKDQIPKSIEHISTGLVGSGLLRLDISNNAVNPFGAEALLIYLKQASSLQVLLIYNCGLGALGTAKIAAGLEGTPSLKTLSIGRNRMTDEGILSIARNIHFVPQLQELFVYQNTLKEGLELLFKNLKENCKNLASLDICDNFVREKATLELAQLIKTNLSLKNLNLSDCLVEEENATIVKAFKESSNRGWERVGYNFAELQEKLAYDLLDVLKACPLKRLDITGNDFEEEVQEAYSTAFPTAGVLSKFEDDDEEEVLKLFEQLKI